MAKFLDAGVQTARFELDLEALLARLAWNVSALRENAGARSAGGWPTPTMCRARIRPSDATTRRVSPSPPVVDRPPRCERGVV